jgi:hypothetical protein
MIRVEHWKTGQKKGSPEEHVVVSVNGETILNIPVEDKDWERLSTIMPPAGQTLVVNPSVKFDRVLEEHSREEEL